MRTYLPQIVYTPSGAGQALLGTLGQMVTLYRDAALTTVESNLQLADGTPKPDGRVLVDVTSRLPRLQVTGGDEVPTVLYAKPDGSLLSTPVFSNAQEALARLESEIQTFNQSADAKYQRVTNVLAFTGVDKTGATDSTAGLQAALNAGAGGEVHIPPGDYKISSALTMPAGTWLRGGGDSSRIFCTSLTSGGPGAGHRMFDAQNVSDWRITDLFLDASAMTGFTTGMRCVYVFAADNFHIARCTMHTPGAATACLNSADFWITDNRIECIATDGITHHDGVIDQWWGSRSFAVRGNVIQLNGLGRYGVLVTGAETFNNTAAACYDFSITENKILNAKTLGIWVNGRLGVNFDFAIANNQVHNVTEFHGIAVSDSRRFTVIGNVIDSVQFNGIRLYQEATLGATAASSATIIGNVVRDANKGASGSTGDGSAIYVLDGSSDLSIVGNRVDGAGHTYAVALGSSTSRIEVIGSNYQAGTLGTISNFVASNRVPGGGTYTPTVTNVNNITSSTAQPLNFRTDGNRVTVTGRIIVQPAAAASTATSVGISLPIPSNLTGANDELSGVASSQFGVVGGLTPDATSDRATLQFPAPNTVSNTLFLNFTYVVK